MGFLKRLMALLGWEPSIEVQTTLPSFHTETDEDRALANKVGYMDEQVARLRKICETVVCDRNLQASGQTTHCNTAVHRIARQFCGYDGFFSREKKDILTANEMYGLVKTSERWSKVDGEWAAEFAMSGGLAIAAQHGEEHGHVAVVYPSAKLLNSPSWGKVVPTLANVGKTNDIGPASKFFRTEPEYFVLKEAKA